MFRFRYFVIALIAIPVSSSLAQEKMAYPDTKQIDQIDEYWGNKVADPYRWLEDDVRTSDEVRKWVEAQNEVTFAHINDLPYRQEIEKRLTSLWDYEKYGTPFKRGDRYFYFKNEGLQNQSVLYRAAVARRRTNRIDRSEQMVGGRHGRDGWNGVQR